MTDILFKIDDYIFSYRVAGICKQNGRILLQKPDDDDGFSFVGGHVAFGETGEETLMREFKEEMGADISVGELKWVGEIFFDWGGKPCHQICLYYTVNLAGEDPLKEIFASKEKNSNVKFYWIPLGKLDDIKIYPENTVELLKDFEGGARHFIYRE